MIIGLEMDRIICSPVSNHVAMGDVEKCKPLLGAKEYLDKLKELGHTIVIYSTRDASLGPQTEMWLQRNKIHYDRIIFNKPQFDILIDKKCHRFKNWTNFFKVFKYPLQNT